MICFMKARPGLQEFLKEVEAYYELHVYTMGTRKYAEAIMSNIDPDGTLFKERILSRDESGSVTQKKLQRLFPCDTSMVVVVDDRSDVWSFSPNLIRIKPYEFFLGTNDHSPQQEKQEMHPQDDMTQEVAAPFRLKDEDDELSTILKILKEIHTTFYATKDPQHDIKEADVTQIIPKMKKRVLKDVIITFSDTILPNQNTKDPTLSWIWQMATSFGAMCSIDLTGKTTHLVAIETSRHKVKAARKYGSPSLHVVTPAWLLDSTAKWAIQPEENYPVLPTHPPHALSDSSDSEEAEEENDMDENASEGGNMARAGTVAIPLLTPKSEDTQSRDEEDARRLNGHDHHLIEDINWDEADREVEEFINESGIDDVWEDTANEDSSASSAATTPKSATGTPGTTATSTPLLSGVGMKRKRHPHRRPRPMGAGGGGGGGGGGESSSLPTSGAEEESSATEAEEEEEEGGESTEDLMRLSKLAKRKLKAKERGKSKLSKVVASGSTTTSATASTTTDNNNEEEEEDQDQDQESSHSSGGNSSDSDTDDSSLSDFADILDEALDQ
ncbi:hypothetical protein BDF20DRAFT_23210 [Mycotypha africana]|uniref:uncharacterized protein n=1 Tax=Mycotypha africana TaxID=64632 RepID=UPI002301CBBA|nr:uncharacterized protein BDF20DRAFT_23210 [Mycotypha africana]KAI8991116.1 hypothetical protein BDF20DRAFT_23210 [Mycotypha africana]